MAAETRLDRPIGECPNAAASYAQSIFRSSSAIADASLLRDFELLQRGHAMYLREALCGRKEFAVLSALSRDIEQHAKGGAGGGMVNWSQHFKHENPEFSPVFAQVVGKMAQHFDLDVYATRLNFYPDNSSWKPFHHDSHAYGGRRLREDLTVGASFGATRSLAFQHVDSGHQFSFPQHNGARQPLPPPLPPPTPSQGDVFAFTTRVNAQFQHGVPKEAALRSGPRFSIIAWGRRRTINAINGGADEVGTRDAPEQGVGPAGFSPAAAATPEDAAPIEVAEDENTPAVSGEDVASLIDGFVSRESTQRQRREGARASAQRPDGKPQRSRVQGGWGGGRGGGSRGGGSRGRGGGGGRGSGRAPRGRATGSGGRTGTGRRPAPAPSYSDDET